MSTKAEYLPTFRTLDSSRLPYGPWLCKVCKEPLNKKGFLSNIFGRFVAVKAHTNQTCPKSSQGDNECLGS